MDWFDTVLTIIAEDYHNVFYGITMSADQDIADLRISTVDDNMVELNESLLVQIGRITSNRPVQIVEPNSTTILIIDNDGKNCSYFM